MSYDNRAVSKVVLDSDLCYCRISYYDSEKKKKNVLIELLFDTDTRMSDSFMRFSEFVCCCTSVNYEEMDNIKEAYT